MKRSEGIRYLTQCADEEGRHWQWGYQVPAEDCHCCRGTNDASRLLVYSRYGPTTGDAAPVAWRLAYLTCREMGEPITREALDHAMSLVVNGHEDVAYIIRTYGHRQYR